MDKNRLTLRFSPEDLAFLTHEAGRHRLPVAEYVRNLIARGLQMQELSDVTSEIKSLLATLPGTSTPPEPPAQDATLFTAQLEALFEMRVLLRKIATTRDATLVTQARTEALDEVQALLQTLV